MPVGRFLDDPTLGTIDVATVEADKANDRFLVHDDSANAVKGMTGTQLLDRLLSSKSITWMSAFADMTAIDANNDFFLVWDASALVFKRLTATEIIDRILTTADIGALSALASSAAVDQAADSFLIWDVSGNAFKTLNAGQLMTGLMLAARTDYTSSPQPLTAAQSGLVAGNNNTTTDILFTLPVASVGMKFSFLNLSITYKITIRPASTELFRGLAAADKGLIMQTVGRVDIRCHTQNRWYVENATCLYTFEAP